MSVVSLKVCADNRRVAEVDQDTVEFALPLARECQKLLQQGPASQSRRFRQQLEESAAKLTEQLLDHQARTNIDELPEGTAIKICGNQGAMHIPWELLTLDELFLSEKFAIGRAFNNESPRVCENRRAICFIRGESPDLTGTLTEESAICRRFRRIANDSNGALEFRRYQGATISVEKLLDTMSDALWMHFAGHAIEVDGVRELVLKSDSKTSKPQESKRTVSPSDLSNVQDTPFFVFLNACGALQLASNEQSKESWVECLMNRGTKWLLGPTTPIADYESRQFTTRFYDQILSGVAIGEAVRQVRLYARHSSRVSPAGFWSYVLYGDPSINILEASNLAIETSVPNVSVRVADSDGRNSSWISNLGSTPEHAPKADSHHDEPDPPIPVHVLEAISTASQVIDYSSGALVKLKFTEVSKSKRTEAFATIDQKPGTQLTSPESEKLYEVVGLSEDAKFLRVVSVCCSETKPVTRDSVEKRLNAIYRTEQSAQEQCVVCSDSGFSDECRDWVEGAGQLSDRKQVRVILHDASSRESYFCLGDLDGYRIGSLLGRQSKADQVASVIRWLEDRLPFTRCYGSKEIAEQLQFEMECVESGIRVVAEQHALCLDNTPEFGLIVYESTPGSRR